MFPVSKKWSIGSPRKMSPSWTISSTATPPSPPSPPSENPTPLFSSYLAGDARHLLWEAKTEEEQEAARKVMDKKKLRPEEAQLVETMARRRI